MGLDITACGRVVHFSGPGAFLSVFLRALWDFRGDSATPCKHSPWFCFCWPSGWLVAASGSPSHLPRLAAAVAFPARCWACTPL
eukprot:13211613-Alexandrium_andersonii.AAC.1